MVDERGRKILDAIIADPEIDAIIVPITGALASMSDRFTRDLVEAQATTRKPIYVVWGSPMFEDFYSERLAPSGIPVFRTFRNTARVAKNEISQAVVAAEAEGKDFSAVADLVKGARGREGLQTGDTNHGIWSAGMIQGLIHDIPTCEVLISRIVADAESIIRQRLAGMLA